MEEKKIIIRTITQLDLDPKLYLWERIILFFCKTHRIDGPEGWVEYKQFWDRLYIVRRHHYDSPQKPVRVTIDQGADTPWKN